MKLSFLALVFVACSVPRQVTTLPCPTPPQLNPSPFHVLGEARQALWDSYELLRDDAAKQRYVAMDIVLIAHENFYIEQDPRYSGLAACTVTLIDQVLPDMAIFGASREAIASMNRAKGMFVALGGSCSELLTPEIDPPDGPSGLDISELDATEHFSAR